MISTARMIHEETPVLVTVAVLRDHTCSGARVGRHSQNDLIRKINMPALVILATILGLMAGCKDDDEFSGTGQLKMYFINTPANYDSVVVVVREVSVFSETQGWVVVNNTTRTFDLLELTDGALLGEASLEAGRYTQIRVVPDTDSYVVVGGRRCPITTPGGFKTGITLAHRFQVEANRPNTLYMNFDANGNACICRCCDQFPSSLHVSMSFESPGIRAYRRLKADKGLQRCKCGDRWDHRQENGQRCRHCTSKNNRVSAIG